MGCTLSVDFKMWSPEHICNHINYTEGAILGMKLLHFVFRWSCSLNPWIPYYFAIGNSRQSSNSCQRVLKIKTLPPDNAINLSAGIFLISMFISRFDSVTFTLSDQTPIKGENVFHTCCLIISSLNSRIKTKFVT